MEAFGKQQDILNETNNCHDLISDCLAKFQVMSNFCIPVSDFLIPVQIVSQLEIHNWQNDFAINSRRDHAEIIEYLSEIQNSQAITKEAMANHSEMLRSIMTMMQDVIIPLVKVEFFKVLMMTMDRAFRCPRLPVTDLKMVSKTICTNCNLIPANFFPISISNEERSGGLDSSP